MTSIHSTKHVTKFTIFIYCCVAIYFFLYFINRDIARVGVYLIALVGIYLIYKDYVGEYNRKFVIWSFAVLCIAIFVGLYLSGICCIRDAEFNKPYIHLLVMFPFLLMTRMLNGWVWWLLIASIFFISAGILAYSYSDYPLFSAKYFESHYGVYLLLAPITYAVYKSNISINYIFIMFIISGILIGLAAIADVTGFARSSYWLFDSYPDQLTRGVGASLNPIHYALIATSVFAVVVTFLVLMSSQLNKKYFLFALISILLLSFSILASGARTAWISIPFIFFVPFIFLSVTLKIKATILAIVLLSAVSVLQVSYVRDRMNLIYEETNEYMNSTDMEDSIRSDTAIGLRIELWKASWEVFCNRPILGVGPGNLRSYMQDNNFGAKGTYHKEIQLHRNPHSLYLKALSERGLLGFLSVLLIFGVPGLLFVSSLRKTDITGIHTYSISGLLIVIVFALGGLTIGSLHKTDLSTFYVFSIALFSGLLLSMKRRFDESKLI